MFTHRDCVRVSAFAGGERVPRVAKSRSKINLTINGFGEILQRSSMIATLCIDRINLIS